MLFLVTYIKIAFYLSHQLYYLLQLKIIFFHVGYSSTLIYILLHYTFLTYFTIRFLFYVSVHTRCFIKMRNFCTYYVVCTNRLLLFQFLIFSVSLFNFSSTPFKTSISTTLLLTYFNCIITFLEIIRLSFITNYCKKWYCLQGNK